MAIEVKSLVCIARKAISSTREERKKKGGACIKEKTRHLDSKDHQVHYHMCKRRTEGGGVRRNSSCSSIPDHSWKQKNASENFLEF